MAGYPVTDLKVQLIDGSFHEVDSNEMAFRMAAIMGFKEGMQKGGPVLLEPVMKVEVVMPEEYLGEVLGQINARRGEIQGMEVRPEMPRHFAQWSHSPKCLVMQPASVRPRKVVGSSRWSLTITLH